MVTQAEYDAYARQDAEYARQEAEAYAELQKYLDAGYTMEQLEKYGGYPSSTRELLPQYASPVETVVKTGDDYEIALRESGVGLGAGAGVYSPTIPAQNGGSAIWTDEQGNIIPQNGGAEVGTNGYGTLTTNGATNLLKTGDSYDNGNVAMATGMNWGSIIAALGGAAGIAAIISNLFGGGSGTGSTSSTAVVPSTGSGGVVESPADYGLTGPGIPEPPAGSYSKTWRIETEDRTGRKVYTYFWRMLNGYIVYYSTSGKVGRFKPKKPIATVMPGGKMNMRDFTRLEKYVDKMSRKLAKASKHLVYK